MKHQHFEKKHGIITRECSKCRGDLGHRYGKQRYCKKCHAESMRKNRPRHSELPEEQRKKANVRSYANQYLKRGLIKRQPCEYCASDFAQMHHDNYDKPLDVRWLCRYHHLELHKQMELG